MRTLFFWSHTRTRTPNSKHWLSYHPVVIDCTVHNDAVETARLCRFSATFLFCRTSLSAKPPLVPSPLFAIRDIFTDNQSCAISKKNCSGYKHRFGLFMGPKTLTFWKAFCWWKSVETDQLLLSDRFLKFEIALKTDPDIPKKLWYYFEGNMTFSYFVSFVFIDLVDQCGYITWRAFISNYPSPFT